MSMTFEDKFIGKTIKLNDELLGKCIEVWNMAYTGTIIEVEGGLFYVLKQGDSVIAE